MNVRLTTHTGTIILVDDNSNTSYPIPQENIQGLIDVLQGLKKTSVIYQWGQPKEVKKVKDSVLDTEWTLKKDDVYGDPDCGGG